MTLQIYHVGLFYISVCAPKEWDKEKVEEKTNLANLCGTSKGWTVSCDETFASGHTNPCECDIDSTRRHWLLAA